MKEIIIGHLEDIKNIVEKISINNLDYNNYEFSSVDLPRPDSDFIEFKENKIYKELQARFKNNKKIPYVYWFEYEGVCGKEKILSSLVAYSANVHKERFFNTQKSELKFFKTPAVKKKTSNSNILYVGKVNKDLVGRLQPHFGFYFRSPNTQGLQFRYWLNDLNLTITLHYISLPKELVGFTGYLERKLAEELKPIIGKHRS